VFGKKKRIIEGQNKTIADLTVRLQAVEAEKAAAEEARRLKEETLARVLTEASVTAQRIVDDADQQAAQTLGETKRETETLIEVAYQNARDIVMEAEQQQRQKLEDTEQTVRDYAALLSQYNEVMKENAAQAETFSRQYAELLQKMMTAVPNLSGVSPVAVGSGQWSVISGQQEPTDEPTEIADQVRNDEVVDEPEPTDEPSDEEGQLWKVSDVTSRTEDSEKIDAIINAIVNRRGDYEG